MTAAGSIAHRRGSLAVVLSIAGLVLAGGAAIAAPSDRLLPGPSGVGQQALAALVLALAFLVGLLWPVRTFYVLVVLTVVDGAIRKWIYNEVVVYLVKDFLTLGIYAAIIPRISRHRLVRPWWLVVPLVGLVALALIYSGASASISEAVVGLGSYFIYVPLLWVAPAIIDRRRRATALLVLICALGIGEALLGAVQSLAGPGALNKLVSGAQPAIVTVNGLLYLRPPGTFMQAGDLSYCLVLALLAAAALFALVASRALLTLAGATIFAVAGSLVFAGARTLFVSGAIVLIPLVGGLLVRRRYLRALLVPVLAAGGLVVAQRGIPSLQAHAVPTVKSWLGANPHRLTQPELHRLTPVRFRIAPQQTVTLWIEPKSLRLPPHPAARLTISAWRADGTSEQLGIPVGALRAGISTGSVPASLPAYVNTPIAGTPGFLARATELNHADAGESTALWSKRVRPLLPLITHPRFLGHGTGTMTLASRYTTPTVGFPGESSYKKAAWELGFPGLLCFTWFSLGLVWLAARGFVLSSGWRRACAVTGLGAAVLVALWMVLTFALDTPIVAELYYVFVGLAGAIALGGVRDALPVRTPVAVTAGPTVRRDPIPGTSGLAPSPD